MKLAEVLPTSRGTTVIKIGRLLDLHGQITEKSISLPWAGEDGAKLLFASHRRHLGPEYHWVFIHCTIVVIW